jgi:hypothetical protein
VRPGKPEVPRIGTNGGTSSYGGWPLRIGQQNGRLNGPPSGPHRGTEVQLIFDVLRETTEEPSELGPEEQASVVLELASADR